jgi:hypothetical protein
MGRIREASRAKLFVAIMHRPGFDAAPVLAQLAGRYGAVEARSDPHPFASAYYEAEMGPGLVKFFVSFGPSVPQERLSSIKRDTNALEEGGADGRGRVCNLDPGLVTHYSVILATTKGYAQRVYLGDGIYAEPALLFRRGAPEFLPWTYPDYRTAEAQAFFGEVRRRLLDEVAAAGAQPD